MDFCSVADRKAAMSTYLQKIYAMSNNHTIYQKHTYQ